MYGSFFYMLYIHTYFPVKKINIYPSFGYRGVCHHFLKPSSLVNISSVNIFLISAAVMSRSR